MSKPTVLKSLTGHLDQKSTKTIHHLSALSLKKFLRFWRDNGLNEVLRDFVFFFQLAKVQISIHLSTSLGSVIMSATVLSSHRCPTKIEMDSLEQKSLTWSHYHSAVLHGLTAPFFKTNVSHLCLGNAFKVNRTLTERIFYQRLDSSQTLSYLSRIVVRVCLHRTDWSRGDNRGTFTWLSKSWRENDEWTWEYSLTHGVL